MVTGSVLPDKGVSEILPSRSGVLTELLVAEGDRVESGDLLAIIRTEQDADTALSAAAQIEKAIARQDVNLEMQIVAANAAAEARLSQLAAQQSGITAEIEQIRAQITFQQDLVAKAENELNQALEVAERGFISGRDLSIREETLLTRRQSLSQLNQLLAARSADLSESKRSEVQIEAEARASEANLATLRSQLGQQAANAAGERSYAIRAPVAGIITALAVRQGQAVSPQTPTMAILPEGSELQAVLKVPSSAIGFLEKGQKVKIAIDAFPYQRFGTIDGVITSLAESPISERMPSGETASVYMVRAKLNNSSMSAFGRREKLLVGMTLSARIIMENRSLIEWLFEPLYAIQ
jgi:membrane fusion protein